MKNLIKIINFLGSKVFEKSLLLSISIPYTSQHTESWSFDQIEPRRDFSKTSGVLNSTQAVPTHPFFKSLTPVAAGMSDYAWVFNALDSLAWNLDWS